LNTVEPLLNNWTINIREDSFKNLVRFIFDNVQSYKIGKDISAETAIAINNWLLLHLTQLENGFYYYEQSDIAFAQTVSYCYDIVQRLTIKAG
jgi:hypothetical protein